MKIRKILTLLVMIIIFLNLFGLNVYAGMNNNDKVIMNDGGSRDDSELAGNEELGLPELGGDRYKPEASSGTIIDKTSTIISVLMVVSIFVGVISIALYGFSLILGSASEKAAAKEKIVGITIGIVVIGSGLAVAKLIIGVAEKF